MINRTEISVRPIVLAMGVLLCIFMTACAPNEQLIYGDSVSSEETINNNLVLSGTDVTVDGDVEGDVFAAGRNVNINGNVGGSIYVAGETIEVRGDVGGNIYSAGLNLELGGETAIAKSVYFAGVRLSTLDGSTIGWDLIAVSLGASLAGDVGRTTRATIGIVELVNIILEQLDTQFNLPNVPQLFPTSGGRLPRTEAALPLEATWMGAAIGALNFVDFGATDPSPPRQSGVDTDQILDTVVDRLKNFAVLLIIGGLLVWLVPNRLLHWTNEGRQHPWASTGYGFVIAIVGYVGFGVVAILLLALLIGIIVAGFWEQALLLGLLTYSGVGLVYGIFLLFVYYGSRIIFSYLLGWMIINRFSPQGTRYRMLSLVLGLLIYEFIRAIPYLGIVVAIVVTFFGLGAAWMALLKIRRGEISPQAPPEVFAQPAPPSPEDPGDPNEAEVMEGEQPKAGDEEGSNEDAPAEEEQNQGTEEKEPAEKPKTSTRRTTKK
jgi:cytoskeletal protein CcmA (bactofilin family)